MKQVNIEDVIDHLSSEMRKALLDAVHEVDPKANVDAYSLLRAFKRAVRRKCNTWEQVPDHMVRD